MHMSIIGIMVMASEEYFNKIKIKIFQANISLKLKNIIGVILLLFKK